MGHNQPSEVDNDQLRAIVEVDPLVTRWEVAEELSVNHSSYLKQTGKVKKFDKWVPHEVKVKVIQSCPISCHPIDYTVHGILQARILEWLGIPFSRESFQPRDQTQVSHIAGRFFISWATREVPKLTTYQKYCHFEESSSLILLNNNESFLDWIVTWDKKWMYTITSHDKLSGWTEKKLQSTSKSQTCTLNGLDHCLVVCCSSDLLQLILEKPLHPRSMFSKLMRCTKNCNAFIQDWPIERAEFFSTIMPDHALHNQCFKRWMNCATQFCHFHHINLTSHQLTTTSLSILTTFCRENTSANSRSQKMFSENSFNTEAWIYVTWISKLSSHW